MSIKTEIYNFIKDESALAGLVNISSVGWVDVDEGTPYSMITFQQISNIKLESDNYRLSDKVQRWRFNIRSTTKNGCESISETLITLFDGLYGYLDSTQTTYIGRIKMEVDSIITKQESIYEKYIDFKFYF